jgi:hypothetical protein
MRKDPVRFTSQWALIGVILFYSVGTTMIARHTKRIFKPVSAGGSERVEYSVVSGKKNHLGPLAVEYPQTNIPGLMQWGMDESTLRLYEIPFDGQKFSSGENAIDLSPGKISTKKKEPREPQLTRIRTKYKCVESILRKADIEPYYDSGQVIGLQLNGLEDIPQENADILKSGDVILAVNGQTLSSNKEAYKIFRGARKEPIMIVDLLHDGEPKKLLLDFQ